MIVISYVDSDISKLMRIASVFPQIEIRIDICDFKPSQFKQIFRNVTFSIATYKGDYNRAKEILLEAIANGANAIDFDYSWGIKNFINFKDSLIKIENNENLQIILSNHSDVAIIQETGIDELMKDMKSFGTNYIKIVALNIDNLKRFNYLNQIMKLIDNKVTIFGDGKYGKKSRVYSYLYGAPICYAAYNRGSKVLDSQLSFSEYLLLLEILNNA